ncbi:MAG: hypothetical protein RLN88_03390 [Ekhidna sp.]|uniref:hypothetical protein n=1 Tax=Ekhidna sp. TaxID=2608089 RepID=UPI0032ED75F5
MRYSGGSLVDVRLRRLSQHLNIETVTAESYFRLICPSENDFNAYLAGTYTLIDQQLSFEVGKAITDQNLVTFKVSIFNSLIGKYARTKTNLRKL